MRSHVLCVNEIMFGLSVKNTWLVCVVLCTLTVYDSNPCGTFEFPDEIPGSNTLRLKKALKLTIRFNINITACPEPRKYSEFIISISKPSKNYTIVYIDICKMLHLNGSCYTTFAKDCACPVDEGPYIVNTTTDLIEWQWRWSSTRDFMKERLITVKIGDDANDDIQEPTKSQQWTSRETGHVSTSPLDIHAAIIIAVIPAMVIVVVILSVVIVVKMVRGVQAKACEIQRPSQLADTDKQDRRNEETNT